MKKEIVYTDANGQKVVVNKDLAKTVLSVVDAGLSYGLGRPEMGKMCVEAAVAYASGEPHNDKPICVDMDLADIKIKINDSNQWKNSADRAAGLRRLAIAQLGSAGRFNLKTFVTIVNKLAAPFIFKDAKASVLESLNKDIFSLEEHLRDIEEGIKIKKELIAKEMIRKRKAEKSLKRYLKNKKSIEKAKTLRNIKPYYVTTLSTNTDIGLNLQELIENTNKCTRSQALHKAAEIMVQALIKMKIPGTKYLYLTNKKKAPAKKKL